MRLAADLGGTKTALALVREDGSIVREAVLETRAHGSPGELLAAFLGPDRPRAACVAVAGPVREGRSILPNLGWTIDRNDFPYPVRLLNDVEAMARAVSELATTTIQRGEPDPQGPVAVVAPGTGLGFAYVANGVAHPSEAGHASFAPTDEREEAWRNRLVERFGRASRERACSGSTYPLLQEFAGDDAPDMFARMLGAIAGDWALEIAATAGVFLAGGMARSFLPSDVFLEAFRDKGRFRAFAERIPVALVTDEQPALKGAIAALPD